MKTTFRLAVSGDRLLVLPLYARDEDIARWVLGDAEHRWSRILGQLEREGLPARSQLLGGVRYMPKILAFFEQREGMSACSSSSFPDDGPERFDP
jgi:hypothetical protein